MSPNPSSNTGDHVTASLMASEKSVFIICEPEDNHGLWLSSTLRQYGVSVHNILPEELIIGSSMSLLFSHGQVSPGMTLASGHRLDDESIDAVVNRMFRFPAPDLKVATDSDLIYAAEESRAAIVAWFGALRCPVFGRPSPYGPCGMLESDVLWRTRAARLGIATQDMHIAGEDTSEEITPEGMIRAITIGSEVLMENGLPTPMEIKQSMSALSRSCHESFFAARFVKIENDFLFCGRDCHPPLALFGERMVETFIHQVLDVC